MEKIYFYNLYRNLNKYNIKISNNDYIKNKINKLIGGTPEQDLQQLETSLITINTDLDNYLRTNTQQEQEFNQFISTITDFLTVIEPYIATQNQLSTQLSGVGLDDAKIQQLEQIKQTFNEIQTKISQLVN